MTVMKPTTSSVSSVSSNSIKETCKVCGEGVAYEYPFLFYNNKSRKWVKYWMLICYTCKTEYAGKVQLDKAEEVRGV